MKELWRCSHKGSGDQSVPPLNGHSKRPTLRVGCWVTRARRTPRRMRFTAMRQFQRYGPVMYVVMEMSHRLANAAQMDGEIHQHVIILTMYQSDVNQTKKVKALS